MTIWYISKYASPAILREPTRQYFLSKYLVKQGNFVRLISSRACGVRMKLPRLGGHVAMEYTVDGIKGILLNGPEIRLGFNLKRIVSWITFEWRLLYWTYYKKHEKPDVVIVSSLSLLTFLSGSLLKTKYKCKLIVEVRDIWPLTLQEMKGWSNKNWIVKLLSIIEKHGYKSADVVIGSMPNLKEHIANILPSRPIKVFPLPMGFDPDFWRQKDVEQKDSFAYISQQFGSSNFIVGYAGSIGLVNCVDHIIKAARILEEFPIHFFILGEGPLKKNICQAIETDQLKNVHILPSVPKDQVHFFLDKCDLLLHPTLANKSIYKYGLSPNKWIDYMWSAKPILVPYDGFRSIINEAGCGKFIKAGDAKILAEEIYKFSLMDKEDLKKMGLKGKEFLLKNMTYSKLAEKLIKIIKGC